MSFYPEHGQLQQSGYTQSNSVFPPSKVTYHLADIAPILRLNPPCRKQTKPAPLPRHVFLPHAALPFHVSFYLEHGQLQQSGYTQSNSVFAPARSPIT